MGDSTLDTPGLEDIGPDIKHFVLILTSIDDLIIIIIIIIIIMKGFYSPQLNVEVFYMDHNI